MKLDIRGIQLADRNDNTHGEEEIDANEYGFCGFEWNLIAVEKESKIKELVTIGRRSPG
jgi:hypothetical protein